MIDMHTIKPLDRDAIARAARKPARSWLRKSIWWMADWACAWRRWSAETHPAPMEFVGIQNTYAESATPDELLDKYGLRARDVAAAARRVVAAQALSMSPAKAGESQRLASELFEARSQLRAAGQALHDEVGPLLSAAGLRLQLLRIDHPEAASPPSRTHCSRSSKRWNACAD